MSLWNDLRKDFLHVHNTIYLDHASAGPIPKPVHEKIEQYYREHATAADAAWPRWINRREKIRAKVAKFINARPEEIAFTSSTSHGMNLVAELLYDQGAVLTSEGEFPASTIPWLWRNAKLIWQKPERGVISIEKLQSLLRSAETGDRLKQPKANLSPISDSIKTILTSFVQYATGFRQDLEALGKMKGDRYLVVNATQGFGALKIDVQKWNVDFLVTNAHKWLMAGYGAGILFIRKKWLERFRPASAGWRSMEGPERMDNRNLDLRQDAARYEMGCPTFASIFGIGAAIDYLTAIGIEKIEARVLELTDFAIEILEKNRVEILSPKEKRRRSAIVVFKAADPQTICKRLWADRIYVSPRGGGIRIAPHFYNTAEEIETFVKKLVECMDVKGEKKG